MRGMYPELHGGWYGGGRTNKAAAAGDEVVVSSGPVPTSPRVL